MADKADTIREMLQGFSTMQAQLGLIPQNQASPLGIALPQLPPMPQVPHPGISSVMAAQQATQMQQNTLQAAQQTRYYPPPSAPSAAGMSGYMGPSLGAMGGQQFNPYVANALGGGGMQGMPNPMYATGAQFGGYRPGLPSMIGAPSAPYQMPSIFNPFLSNPGTHFSDPNQYGYGLGMQQRRQHLAGGVAAMGGALETGGGWLGGALGSPFGIIGEFAGSAIGRLGGRMMGGVMNLAARPALREIGIGQQFESMSQGFMSSGPGFNTLSGGGGSREMGLQVGHGIVGMGRDRQLGRQTGFNTGDYQRILQLSGEEGLLDLARNSDQVLQTVKTVSKSLKVFMQITGDPDVRSAMKEMAGLQRLGMNMPELNNAMMNARSFSRMAGTTVAGANAAFGMPGAMMGQQVGLSGAVGWGAGMAGGGMARMGVGAGSFTPQQLALLGGMQGVGQTNAMTSIAAMNMDALLPGMLSRGAGGKLGIDSAQVRSFLNGGADIRSLSQQGAAFLHGDTKAIGELASQKQELKDTLARTLSPIEQQMFAIRLGLNMQREGHLPTLGAGLRAAGLGEKQARTLELEWTNPQFRAGMEQQMGQMERDDYQRRRSSLYAQRSPGLGENITRANLGFQNRVADTFAEPFRAYDRWSAQLSEDKTAQRRGERIVRYGDSSIVHDAREQGELEKFMGSTGYDRYVEQSRGGVSGPQSFGNGGVGSSFNRAGNMLGLTTLDTPNRLRAIGVEAAGGSTQFWGGGFLAMGAPSAQSSYRTIQSMQSMSRSRQHANAASTSEHIELVKAANKSIESMAPGASLGSITDSAVSVYLDNLNKKTSSWGGLLHEGAETEDDARTAIITAAKQAGMSPKQADDFWNQNKEAAKVELYQRGRAVSGGKQGAVTAQGMRLADEGQAASGPDFRGVDAAKAYGRNIENRLGLRQENTNMVFYNRENRKYSDKDVSKYKKLLAGHDSTLIEYAGLDIAIGKGGAEGARALAMKKELMKGKSIDERTRLQEQINVTAEVMTKQGIGDVASHVSLTSGRGKDPFAMIKDLKDSVEGDKAAAAVSSWAKSNQAIGGTEFIAGGSAETANVKKMLTAMSEDDANKLGLGALKKRMGNARSTSEEAGVAADFRKSIPGVSGNQVIGGMATEEQMAQRASLRGLGKTLEDQGDTAQGVFAETVATFADATDKFLKGADALNDAMGKSTIGSIWSNWGK